MRFKFYTFLLMFIIAVIFFIQNPIFVDIKLAIWEIKIVPLGFLVVAPFLISMLVGIIFGIIKTIYHKRRLQEKDKLVEIYKKGVKKYEDLMAEDGTPIGKLIIKKKNKENT